MSVPPVHRAASSLVRLTLVAALALPPVGGMPAGAGTAAAVMADCAMTGHASAAGAAHAMPAAAGHDAHGMPSGATGPSGHGDDPGAGCHCCRECGCPAAAEAGVEPAIDAGVVPAIIAMAPPVAPVGIVRRRTPRTLLPPPTGPPVLSA